MKFSNEIIKWYKLNKRKLPWRNTNDPYKIWLSEIILQQTRIDQGINYYNNFVKTFPDVMSLANSSEENVLKLWQGLGYYTRARNLYKTANIIAHKFNGKFPNEYNEIIQLPGIGVYTAAAIASMAFNKSYPVVDGNVFRVITRVFAIDTPIDSGQGKKLVMDKALEIIDTQKPGIYNQAIMEFGALYCKPKNPDCLNCIFTTNCLAYRKKFVEKLPVKISRPVQRYRYFYYLLICYKSNESDYILINKRGGNDIWKNLYDFPLIESNKKISLNRVIENGFNGLVLKNKTMKLMGNEYKHILSHQVILARFIRVEIKEKQQAEIQKNIRNEKLIPIKTRDLVHFPIPRLIEKFLEENRLF